MIELAAKNANRNLEIIKINELNNVQNDYNAIGAYLQEKLKLTKVPHTIECYDISHIQGTNTVASGVYFENGIPKTGWQEIGGSRYYLTTTDLCRMAG